MSELIGAGLVASRRDQRQAMVVVVVVLVDAVEGAVGVEDMDVGVEVVVASDISSSGRDVVQVLVVDQKRGDGHVDVATQSRIRGRWLAWALRSALHPCPSTARLCSEQRLSLAGWLAEQQEGPRNRLIAE